MFGEFSLPPQPAPMRVLKDCLKVTGSRVESNLFVDPEYVIESVDTPGPCEADAIFRVFEGGRAPAPPLTDEERADLVRRRQPVTESYDETYDERMIDAKDVQRVCKALVEPERVNEEVRFFLQRFGMADPSEEHEDYDNHEWSSSDDEEEDDDSDFDNNSSGGESKSPGGSHDGGATDAFLAGLSSGIAMSVLPTTTSSTTTTPTPTTAAGLKALAKRRGTTTGKLHALMIHTRPLSLRQFKAQLQKEASELRLNKWDVVFLHLEDPTSSTLSLYLAMFIMCLILLSSFGGVFETLPVFLSTPPGQRCTKEQGCVDAQSCDSCTPELNTTAFRQIEVLCTSVFTVEYIFRLCCVGFSSYGATADHVELQVIASKGHKHHALKQAKQKLSTSGRTALRKVFDFVRDPMNVIDAIAIVPFYVEWAYDGEGVEGLNVIRLLRIARVFRMTKSLDTYRNWVLLLTEVIVDSMSGLQILAFVFFLGLVLFASLLFFTEQGVWRPPPYTLGDDDDVYDTSVGMYTRTDLSGFGRERSPFSSIPRAMWFVIVTGPTTGFGDMFPTTKMGKFIATFLVLGTMLVLAFPVTIIAKNMNDKYVKLMNQEPPPDPYTLPSMVRRHMEVEAIGRDVTDKVTAMRDAFLVDDDDACWIASQIHELAERYSESRQTAGHWDSCMMAVLAVLQRQPECSEKIKLRKLILLFAEASLM